MTDYYVDGGGDYYAYEEGDTVPDGMTPVDISVIDAANAPTAQEASDAAVFALVRDVKNETLIAAILGDAGAIAELQAIQNQIDAL